MTSIEEQINNFVDMIFTNEPAFTKSYIFEYNGSEEQLNHILINILINGSKRIFGDSTYIPNLSEENFNFLNKYIESIGFTVKREFKYNEEKIIDVRIWFEKLD